MHTVVCAVPFASVVIGPRLFFVEVAIFKEVSERTPSKFVLKVLLRQSVVKGVEKRRKLGSLKEKKKEKMALSDLPDVLGMEERGASSNSGGVSVESYKEIFSKAGSVD